MNDKVIKILFIIGNNRSGTTILQNVLGQLDGYVSVGELKYIWDRGFVRNKLCGCGVPFRECEFWMTVSKQSPSIFNNNEPYQLFQLGESFRVQHLLTTVIPDNRYAHFHRLASYMEAVENTYQAIQSVTGSRIIVDSSKNPAYGYLLSHMSSIDLRILHVIRDSRAVAYSWSKKKLFQPGTINPYYMPQKGPVICALQWDVRNTLIELWFERTGKNYMQLRYEDFVKTPCQTVESIIDFVGEPATRLPFISDTEVMLEKSHSVFGNLVRFQTGKVSIQHDVEWMSKISNRSKALVTLLTLPLLYKYGYLKRKKGETV